MALLLSLVELLKIHKTFSYFFLCWFPCEHFRFNSECDFAIQFICFEAINRACTHIDRKMSFTNSDGWWYFLFTCESKNEQPEHIMHGIGSVSTRLKWHLWQFTSTFNTTTTTTIKFWCYSENDKWILMKRWMINDKR